MVDSIKLLFGNYLILFQLFWRNFWLKRIAFWNTGLRRRNDSTRTSSFASSKDQVKKIKRKKIVIVFWKKSKNNLVVYFSDGYQNTKFAL